MLKLLSAGDHDGATVWISCYEPTLSLYPRMLQTHRMDNVNVTALIWEHAWLPKTSLRLEWQLEQRPGIYLGKQANRRRLNVQYLLLAEMSALPRSSITSKWVQRSSELSQMDAMHLHVLLYKSKIYLFLINYLFIIASYESCFIPLCIVDVYLFIAKRFHIISAPSIHNVHTSWRCRISFQSSPTPQKKKKSRTM